METEKKSIAMSGERTFNRTNLEWKRALRVFWKAGVYAFNRTNLEWKL